MTDQQPGGSGAGSTVDLVKVMQEIAASGEIDVPDQVEFNGTLYVRATALEAARGEIEKLKRQLADEHEVGTLEHARQHLSCGQVIASNESDLAQARARIERYEHLIKQLRGPLGAIVVHGSEPPD